LGFTSHKRYWSEVAPSCVLRAAPMMALLVLLVQSFGGCDNAAKPEGPGGSGGDGTDIFPLAVGNKWLYDWSWASDSVTASVPMNGVDYYVMRGSSLEIVDMPAYVRMNDEKQLIAWTPVFEDQVFFDFGVETGSQWDYAWGYVPRRDKSDTVKVEYTATLYSRSDTVAVPAGVFPDCCLFLFHAKHAVDADWGFWVAPETGIVKFGGGKGVEYELVEFVDVREPEGLADE
jgi:hypothetical protein